MIYSSLIHTDAYFSFNLSTNNYNITNFNNDTLMNFNGSPARKIIFNSTNILDPHNYDVDGDSTTNTIMQIWAIKNSNVYTISYNANSEIYNDYFLTIEKIIKSIKL